MHAPDAEGCDGLLHRSGLAPLRAVPPGLPTSVTALCLRGNHLADLAALSGLRLRSLDLASCGLRGLPGAPTPRTSRKNLEHTVESDSAHRLSCRWADGQNTVKFSARSVPSVCDSDPENYQKLGGLRLTGWLRLTILPPVKFSAMK